MIKEREAEISVAISRNETVAGEDDDVVFITALNENNGTQQPCGF